MNDLIESIFTPPIDEVSIGTVTAEEKEAAGDAFAVELHHRVDGSAGIEPLPSATTPEDRRNRRRGRRRSTVFVHIDSERNLDHAIAHAVVEIALPRGGADEQIAFAQRGA